MSFVPLQSSFFARSDASHALFYLRPPNPIDLAASSRFSSPTPASNWTKESPSLLLTPPLDSEISQPTSPPTTKPPKLNFGDSGTLFSTRSTSDSLPPLPRNSSTESLLSVGNSPSRNGSSPPSHPRSITTSSTLRIQDQLESSPSSPETRSSKQQQPLSTQEIFDSLPSLLG